MSKHTKGPWAVLTPNPLWCGRPIDDYAITVDDHDTWICTGPTWDEDKHDESLANARLIAAAPELLQALQKLVECAGVSDDCAYGTLSTGFVRDIASSAILKATGEQP